jgi:hypothetical protein
MPDRGARGRQRRRARRRPWIGAPVAVWGILAGGASGQVYPIFTASDLEKTMTIVGQNFGALSRLVDGGNLEDAKARAVRTREQLATTITFWRERKRDDAIKMLRAAMNRLDELDTTLSAERIDKNAASTLLGEVDAACQACHARYREQDPGTKAYRLKAGVLP